MFYWTFAIYTLKNYKPQGRDDDIYKDQFLTFLKNIDPMTGQSRDGILCGSGWVVDSSARKILLMWNAKMNRWLNPGGKFETADRTLQATATREVWQEAGVEAQSEKISLIDIDVITPKDNPLLTVPLYDTRFLIEADSTLPLGGELDKKPGWYGFDEAKERLGNPERNSRLLKFTEKLFF